MPRDAEVREIAQRRYWRAAEGRIVVEAWRGSGEKLASFVRRYGLSRKRVSWWASRLEGGKPGAVRFHPVRLVAGGGIDGAAIELELRRGWRLRLPRGFEAEDLRRVLAVLEERSGC